MPSSETATAVDLALAQAAAAELEDALKKGMNPKNALSLLENFQKEATIEANTVGTSDHAGEELVTLWHNITGEPHPTPVYMVEKYVRRRFPKEEWIPQEMWAKPVWSITQTVPMKVGPFVCHLHAESPKRAQMTELGLGHVSCVRKGLPNQLSLEQHMRSTHKDEWQTIQHAEDMRRADELLDLQRQQVAAFTALLEAQKAQIKPTGRKPAEE